MKIGKAFKAARKRLSRWLFHFLQRRGIHLVPNRYHFPVPDTRKLKDDLWTKPSQLAGIELNEECQLNLLQMFLAKYKGEYEEFSREKTPIPHQYYLHNNHFESVDGEVLYCMIRHFRPGKVIEIGSGYSTYLTAQALLKNKSEYGQECELTAIEPYPGPVLKRGFPGLTQLITAKVEDVPLATFAELSENDILFIDSSHMLKIGSDVQYEYLEILPRLNKGVIIHVHDIFLPAEYPRAWVINEHKFWTEQYLLQAFLAFNDSFDVLWAGSFLHLKYSEKLNQAFNSYNRDKNWPGSFWMRKAR